MVLGKIQLSSFQHESSDVEQILRQWKSSADEIFPPQSFKDH